jgi:hypothetical protein
MTLKSIFLFLLIIFLNSCAEYSPPNYNKGKQKKYFSSSGFALIYSDEYYNDSIVNKKINTDKLIVMHSSLKLNTPIIITNPINSISIETKIHKRAQYPNIFNVVISNKISSILKLDKNDPFIEIIEVKKNKKFVAKKSNTFDEEKNVSGKAPVDEVTMDILSDQETLLKDEKKEKNNFIIIINDFYYSNSANSLKNSLIGKSKDKNIKVKKINNTKYRLYAGPFKNFNALKTTYISLNNLGFTNLNIYKE